MEVRCLVPEDRGAYLAHFSQREYPAWFSRYQALAQPVFDRLDTPEEIAAAFMAKMELGMNGGMLITNPIPHEYAMDPDEINKTIDQAIRDANELGIKGKALTPYLLDHIQKMTGGRSLESNIQLVLNNARLGAKIACAMCDAQEESL